MPLRRRCDVVAAYWTLNPGTWVRIPAVPSFCPITKGLTLKCSHCICLCDTCLYFQNIPLFFNSSTLWKFINLKD
ncbi:Hypothetical protein SRAE_1000198400 [Strongyloides ratti]|uniref:Uncharacterized protein n=1 Tax=Strongyloides ratti TaxID=34506 RepID=A0A090L1R6_STRRB|nr:Hypothetical protein SRAE_1000198400 [Strongyloides ratti]CEF63726.1 Hypothetical protein SRAE_1000198400 [Strongyloides ratti]